MTKSFRIQENVYSTYLKLKTRKKQQQFLEKCFIFAWENREIETDYDVELAFSGVKPSIKLSENGGGLNNPKGINGTKSLKNKENDISLGGQSEVRVRSDSGQTFISNKNKDISIKEKEPQNRFDEFWLKYKPVNGYDGRVVAKGSKIRCLDKYKKIIQDVDEEKIISGLEKYLNYCKKNKICSCGCEVFLNQKRWEIEYGDIQDNNTQEKETLTQKMERGAELYRYRKTEEYRQELLKQAKQNEFVTQSSEGQWILVKGAF